MQNCCLSDWYAITLDQFLRHGISFALPHFHLRINVHRNPFRNINNSYTDVPALSLAAADSEGTGERERPDGGGAVIGHIAHLVTNPPNQLCS